MVKAMNNEFPKTPPNVYTKGITMPAPNNPKCEALCLTLHSALRDKDQLSAEVEYLRSRLTEVEMELADVTDALHKEWRDNNVEKFWNRKTKIPMA
jgi:hypothetical protein